MTTGADSEIIVQLTADTAQLQTGMDAGTASVQRSTDAMRASVAEAMSQYAAFDAIQKGSIQTADDLAAAQKALSAAQESGAFTAEELSAKQAIVAAAMSSVGTEAKGTAGAIEAITSNSRTMYSVSALVTDAMTGQFSRMRREVAAVGNETGLMGRALTLLLSPLGLVAAALAGIAAAAVSAKDAIDKLATSVAAGGGMAGMSKDQLEGMAQGFKQMGYDVSTARGAMDALSASGKVAAESMRSATQASLDIAQLTGTSAEKVAAQLSRLGSSGLDGILRMDEQYHFLNDSQREHIAQMFQEGQATQGVKEAFDALATSEHARVETLKQDQGDVEGFWARMGTHIANAWDSTTKTLHMGLTDSEQVAHLDKVIAAEQKMGATGEYINGLLAKRAALQQAIAQQAMQATAQGAAAAHGSDEDQAMLHKGRSGVGGTSSVLEKRLHDEEAQQKISYDHRAQFEMEYWGQILQTSKVGSAEYTLAWKNVQTLQKSLDDAQLADWKKNQSEMASAARKAASDATAQHRKMAQEEMTDLQMTRSGTEANTAERIQADAAILASATRLYGANSSQQKATLTQMLADEKAYNASVIALQAQETQTAIAQAQARMDAKRAAVEQKFALGQMSRQQEIAAIAAANAEEYRLEMQQYAKELALLDAKYAATEKVEQKIATLQKKYAAEAEKTTTDQQKVMEQSWKKALKPIDNAFQQSINGMIRGTQTFKKGLDNILLSIVASYAQLGIKTVMDWIANEGAKTSASAAGAAARATIEDTAATQTKVTDATTGKSQITTAAATGAAKAYQAIVGIPYVGPVLAPIAAGVAFAGIEAFSGMLSSAEGGWERVPADGMMTELHKNEMVLPATVADHVRNSMGSKGAQSGGGGQIHIHANDARSFKDMLRRNPGALTGAMRQAIRMGHR